MGATIRQYSQGAVPRVSLLIYHRGGAETVPLSGERTSVVLGRSEPADVQIRDSSLSRQHARVAAMRDEVWIEDLGSTNGTKVNGQRISTARVGPGDEVTMGAVTVAVHLMRSGEEATDELDSHEEFVRQLSIELVRTKSFGRPLCLLMLRAQKKRGAHVTSWFPTVRSLLRPVDRVALYSPDTLEILLPETDRAAAQTLAERLLARNERTPLVCSIAVFPAAGGTAAELLQVARKRVLEANPQQPIVLAGTPVFVAEGGKGARLLGQSAAMQEVVELVRRVARTPMTVLIVGETGVGKELVARAIHEQGPRREQPMHCINCAAIPATLIESVLFGHERGAFTGADRRTKGVFEQASGGTVFLDEVGELSPEAQAALLRVLETKQITRVGSPAVISVDVRIIAATHRDLEVMCSEGTFREDLYYRLNTVTIPIPPLRRRSEEIPALGELFLREANAATGREVQGIDAAAMAVLRRHQWPGNVRELRNAIERAVVISPGETITVEDLPERVRQPRAAPAAPAGPAPGGIPAEGGLRERLRAFEIQLIEEALAATGGNQTEAARLLEIPRRTLVRKLRDLEIGHG